MAGSPNNPIGPYGEGGQELAEAILILAFPEFAPIIAAAFQIIEFVEELIGTLLALFTGRPREEATIQVAKRLMNAVNPAARHWGLCMIRALHQWDIVISESGAGSHIEGAMFANFVQNMVLQGVDKNHAREIGVAQLSREAQAGAPYPPELRQPLPDGFFITGPGGLDNLYQKLYNRFIDQGDSPTEAMNRAQQRVFNAAPLRWVFKVQFTNVQPVVTPGPGNTDSGGGIGIGQGGGSGDGGGGGSGDGGGGGGGGGGGDGGGGAGQTGRPDPISFIDPLTGDQLPQGFGWDPTTQQGLPLADDGSLTPPPGYQWNPCTNSTVVAPPLYPAQWPPPAPPPTPTPETGSQGIDACCNLIAVNLQYLAMVVAAVPLAPGANLIAPQLEVLNASVANIATELSKASTPGSGADLTTVVQAIRDLTTQIQAIPKSVSDASAQAHADTDVPHALIQQLIADGFIDETYSGLLQGTPSSWVQAILNAVSPSNLWRKYNQSVLKGVENDPVYGPTFRKVTTGRGKDINDLSLDDLGNAAKVGVGELFKAAFDAGADIFGPIINIMLSVHRDEIGKLGQVRPGDELPAASALISEAITFGTAAHFASVAAEAFQPFKNLGVSQISGLFAELAGFEEIMRGIIGVEVQQAVALPHRYYINSQKRALQPGLAQANSWFARRLIDDPTWQKLIGYNGLHPDYETPAQAAAFQPISPRLLVRELGVFNVDRAQIVDAMRFSGNRDSDIDLTIAAQEQAGLARLAQPVINQLITAAADGLFSDDELTAEFQALNLTSAAVDMLLQHVRVQRLHKLSTSYKSELDEAAKGSVITIEDYRSSLAAIGYQQTEVDVFSGIVSVYLEKRTLEEEARLQARQARDVQNTLIKTAIQEFRRGNLVGAALSGALASGGLTASQVAAHVALESVKLEPTVKAGSTLSTFAQGQALLSAQRKAVIEEYSKGLITPGVARERLKALGVSDDTITAELNYEYAKAAKKADLIRPEL